jgi:site-specific DNA-cytosine methylase
MKIWKVLGWTAIRDSVGHRYRVLGNSMVVPVMRWIGEGFPV